MKTQFDYLNKQYEIDHNCPRCKYGQMQSTYEPVMSRNTIPPFKTMKVLKCFQCSYSWEIS